ncbi:ABC transporter substrate-binding protein [Vibrio fluvialis]|nr:ABC transporter substrate-binding protein [Vibrio fluvialis]MBY7877900.1 ABC transporter substrate-binding protein [Vibrio fluvialis]
MGSQQRGFTRLAVVGAVLMLAVLASALFIWRGNEAQSVIGAKPIRIAVSQTPLSSPFFIASKLKFFQQQGLDVTLVPCSGGVACADSLFNGSVDFATASESVVMFKSFERHDFVLLASFVSSDNDLKLLTLDNRNIKSIEDLGGKRVGVVKASSSEFYLDSVLLAHNLKNLNLEKVYLSPDQLNQALYGFSVDAISVWEPWGYRTEMTSASKVKNLGIHGIYNLSFNLMAMKERIDSNEEESIRVLEALKQAIAWMNANPEQARHWVATSLNIREHQLEWSWQDYVFRLSLGNALLSNIQLQARWALENKLVKGELPDYRRYFASEPLEQVLQTEVSFK